MSWTAPTTRTTGELITASIYNTDLVDNLNALTAQVTTVTTTGNITSLTVPSGRGDLIVRMNNASLATVQGIPAGFAGQRLFIRSVGAGQVDLAHQNGSATAANRLVNFATVGTTSLAAGSGTAEYVYDATTARWVLVAHDQGAWIVPGTPTFSGSGAQTFTSVSAASTPAYMLRGRTLHWFFDYQGAVGGTPDVTLRITYPAGYQSNRAQFTVHNNLTDNRVALAQIDAGGTYIQLFTDSSASTTWSGGTHRVMGIVTLEVQ